MKEKIEELKKTKQYKYKFILCDNQDDRSFGIIKTDIELDKFEKICYQTHRVIFEDEELEPYDDYYETLFDKLWELGYEFEVEYINQKIYL
jgi:hypothetical protein